MKRVLLSLMAVVALLAPPASAQAAFGLHGLDVTFTGENDSAATQAGSHPFAMTNALGIDTVEDPVLKFEVPEEDFRDLTVSFAPGLVADRNAAPQCAAADFTPPGGADSKCAAASQLGVVDVEFSQPDNFAHDLPVYNLIPSPGVVAKLGFRVEGVPVVVDLTLSQSPPYNGIARLANTLQALPFYSSELTIWGTPASSAHDAERGGPVDAPERPFLTLPRSCTGPLPTTFRATSWQGGFFEETVESHGDGGEALGMTDCGNLGFNPSASAQPTSRSAGSPSGLDFGIDVANEGLSNPTGRADSDIKEVAVTLPEGMTINPSQAEGLGVCSESGLQGETLDSQPGEGCPQSSKIGSIEVESPLADGEILKGALFIATPYENLAGDSLIAFYVVIKNPELGILVKQPARVDPNPVSGQLVATTKDMPQLPFSHFRLRFREGARSPLVTPPSCDSDPSTPANDPYTTRAVFTPWANPNAPYTATSSFQITNGVGGGPCPSGGLPPFKPGLLAGTLNNSAGRYSPFLLRLFRSDAEQEITHFSIKLPPGIVGKLAGIPFCPEAAIAAAKARTGPLGGHEELAAPSCPAASEVGRTLAGAGVGSALTYVPGKIYLAGPYNGSALSIVAITSGVAGPFDLGTVLVRQALKINPETAEVFIDATGSDPIPHIIQGIPVHLRDIRAYVERPEFVLNPTSCSRTSTASTVLGSGLNFASPADDVPVTVSTPFQAADCASLDFKPRLSLTLKGGTKRGQNPALRAVLRPRAGDANSRRISVQLPHSEFLDQAHIRTVCTRVQFKAGAGNGAQCPPGSIYGKAKAWTPLLSEPLEGPVFLRSSENPLPDLVLALSGLIDFNAVGRIDSVDGGIRNTFDFVPDAPVTKVVVDFEGGKKGLLENSTNLCRAKNKAIVKYQGHNGKRFNAKPVLVAKCPKAKKGKGKGAKRSARGDRRRGH